jgi:hypothetical protein
VSTIVLSSKGGQREDRRQDTFKKRDLTRLVGVIAGFLDVGVSVHTGSDYLFEDIQLFLWINVLIYVYVPAIFI